LQFFLEEKPTKGSQEVITVYDLLGWVGISWLD